MVVISRDQLHEEVWLVPIVKLAMRYGTSVTSLKEICVKRRIPIPPRNYWANVAAGIKVNKTHYRSISDTVLNKVTIDGNRPFKKAVNQAKVQKAITAVKETPRPQAQTILKKPDVYHNVAKDLKARLQNTPLNYQNLCEIAHDRKNIISVSKASIERITIFLHHFCQHMEKCDHKLEITEEEAVIVANDEKLTFEIIEKVNSSPYTMNEDEAIEMKAWEKKRNSKSWDISFKALNNPPDIPHYDYQPTGSICFQITSISFSSHRRKFSDGKIQRLESLIDKIVESASEISIANIAQREKWARWERERKAEAKAKRLIACRIQTLEVQSAAWHKANQMRAFVRAVQDLGINMEDQQLDKEWLEWVNNYIDKHDPLKQGMPRLIQLTDIS